MVFPFEGYRKPEPRVDAADEEVGGGLTDWEDAIAFCLGGYAGFGFARGERGSAMAKGGISWWDGSVDV
jgi:hypothetical protein